jgi:hypothetical protein
MKNGQDNNYRARMQRTKDRNGWTFAADPRWAVGKGVADPLNADQPREAGSTRASRRLHRRSGIVSRETIVVSADAADERLGTDGLSPLIRDAPWARTRRIH